HPQSRSYADDGLLGRLGLRHGCKLAERDRLHWGTQAIVADLLRRYAASISDQLRDCETAQPALAWTHAAAKERLHLVGTGGAERNCGADSLRRDLFAAAHDRIALRDAEGLGWLIQRVK